MTDKQIQMVVVLKDDGETKVHDQTVWDALHEDVRDNIQSRHSCWFFDINLGELLELGSKG